MAVPLYQSVDNLPGWSGLRSEFLKMLGGRLVLQQRQRFIGERATLVRELVEKVVVDDRSAHHQASVRAAVGGGVPSSASEDGRDNAVELAAAIAFKRRGAKPSWCCRGQRSRTTDRDVIRR